MIIESTSDQDNEKIKVALRVRPFNKRGKFFFLIFRSFKKSFRIIGDGVNLYP